MDHPVNDRTLTYSILGALHEVRESEELASWVEAQNKFVKSDSGRVSNKSLISQKLMLSGDNHCVEYIHLKPFLSYY